jgi:hypothetical protein
MSAKKQFSLQEDQVLVTFVSMYGAKSWTMLSQLLPTRSARQCRERWHNHLDPAIRKSAWSQAEDQILAAKHRELGNRWAEIATFLPGRTDVLVKNRWNTSVKDRLPQIEADLHGHLIVQPLGSLPWRPQSLTDFTTIPPFIRHGH